MVAINSFIHGIFPRSEKLIKISRDYDRKRASLTSLHQQQKQDTKNLFSQQKKLKFKYIEDGKLCWQDIFRPFTDHSQGIKTGSLTRYFDNNTFFRQPIIKGKIKFNQAKILDYFCPDKAVNKITLPSFFYLAKISDNNYYKNLESFLSSLAEQYHFLVKKLEKRGINFVQLNDPYVVYHKITNQELIIYKKAFSQFRNGLTSTIALHTFFGNISPLFNELINFPHDVLGFDCFKTNLEELTKQKVDKSLILGCLDSRSPVMENKKMIKGLVTKVVAKFNPPQIYLTTSSELEFLTSKLAYKKIEIIKNEKN